MHVVTPNAIARHTDTKYLGVLVAAKYARSLNEFRRGQLAQEPEIDEASEKLTTTALEAVARGEVEYRLTPRLSPTEL